MKWQDRILEFLFPDLRQARLNLERAEGDVALVLRYIDAKEAKESRKRDEVP